jgi:hypothetical protein
MHGVDKMQMKKILGILLAFCFLMSVTVAAVSAAVNTPVIDKNHGNPINKPVIKSPGNPINKPVIKSPGNPINNQFDKNGYNKYGYNRNGYDKFGYNKNGYDKFGHKKGYHAKGHWMYKKTRHNKDRNHKSYWYTNDKYWQPY